MIQHHKDKSSNNVGNNIHISIKLQVDVLNVMIIMQLILLNKNVYHANISMNKKANAINYLLFQI